MKPWAVHPAPLPRLTDSTTDAASCVPRYPISSCVFPCNNDTVGHVSVLRVCAYRFRVGVVLFWLVRDVDSVPSPHSPDSRS